MRCKLLVFGLVVTALICSVLSAEKPRKSKKLRNKSKPVIQKDEAAVEKVQTLENDVAVEIKASSSESDSVEVPVVPVLLKDPCANKHCGAGRVCQITEEGLAECACVEECYPENEPRRHVCSNHNETWRSDCEVYQMRCWCDHNSPQCTQPMYQHLHIDYYGACKQMPKCEENEMMDFPRRMRDWLFNIMRDMADRDELTPHYRQMEQEAETNNTNVRRWTNAAIWKWCDLDGHPHDRFISRHELFPIRAPLMALEHCIAPFLNSCDVDDDHRITLKEWGKCLNLPEDELEERCEEIRDEEARG